MLPAKLDKPMVVKSMPNDFASTFGVYKATQEANFDVAEACL